MQSVSTYMRTNDPAMIFVDKQGQPIKFRIQPSFSQYMRAMLEDAIASHGGLVITKIPVRGFVVIDPLSHAGCELVHEWAWKERPARNFVAYTFIQQCIGAQKMLPVKKHFKYLNRIISRFNLKSDSKVQELSQMQKMKLALYLAMIFPDRPSGNRSSNKVYKLLIKNKTKFPWVKDHKWQTFRNHYLKNKNFYDRLISKIVSENGLKSTIMSKESRTASAKAGTAAAAAVASTLYEKFLFMEKPTASIEAVVSGKISIFTEEKRARFNRTFIIERKRRNKGDIGKNGGKIMKNRSSRTIDDMLHAPIPRIVAERKFAKRQTKTTSRVSKLAESFDEDLEVKRGSKVHDIQKDIWIDDSFKDKNRSLGIPLEEHVLENNFMTAFDDFCKNSFGLDADDFRTAAKLNILICDYESDISEEEQVKEILGLADRGTEAEYAADFKGHTSERKDSEKLTTGSRPQGEYQTASRVAVLTQKPAGPEEPTIWELAHITKFTHEEVKQRLWGFSGDVEKTLRFLMKCRRVIDGMFAESKKELLRY